MNRITRSLTLSLTSLALLGFTALPANAATHKHGPKPPKIDIGCAASVVEVAKGDTLWSLSRDMLGDPKLWKQLVVTTHGKVLKHPDPRRLSIGSIVSTKCH